MPRLSLFPLALGLNVPPCKHPLPLSPLLCALTDMSANDPGFILFGQKMSASQIPATSSPIPSNSPPEYDRSSSKKSEAGMPFTENSEQQQNEHRKNEATKISSAEEFKMMKKPDKIQQCPRCNSMDTKFCYFNNYNVNQPRHFCKSCHRYWTAGGAMRNVPVGAGRRRNRQLSSPYHRQTAASSEGIPVPTPNTDSSSQQRFTTLESSSTFKSSAPPDNTSTVLRFGPEDPISESASSILTNASGGARGNEVSELAMQWNRGVSNLMNTSNGVRCYPTAPWVFPVQWYADNKIGSPNIPVQFVACWSNGTGVSIGSNGCLSSSTSTSNGPALGKH